MRKAQEELKYADKLLQDPSRAVFSQSAIGSSFPTPTKSEALSLVLPKD